MRLSNPIKLLAVSILLASAQPSYAQSAAAPDAGPSNGGGGNSINGHLIEEYVVGVDQIPGYADAEKYLQKVKGMFPGQGSGVADFRQGLGDLLEQKMKEKTWYLIPANNRQISASVTGLSFPSDQTAAQVNGEIFISQPSFNQLAPASQGILILHETVMATLIDLNSASAKSVDLELIHKYTRNVVENILTQTDADQMSERIFRSVVSWEIRGNMGRDFGGHLLMTAKDRQIVADLANQDFATYVKSLKRACRENPVDSNAVNNATEDLFQAVYKATKVTSDENHGREEYPDLYENKELSSVEFDIFQGKIKSNFGIRLGISAEFTSMQYSSAKQIPYLAYTYYDESDVWQLKEKFHVDQSICKKAKLL
jgi:hypothetical protein